MENLEKEKSGIEKVGEDLFNFAVDREDVKALIAMMPKEGDINPIKVEYELQILKIISVGWSLSYYLESSPQKSRIAELYWKSIQEFSQNISKTTHLMIGQDIDYFQILKDRLDMYVDAMEKRPDASEPAVVIGPKFAGNCGNVNDVYTVITGSRMFINVIREVKEYLEAIKLR